MEDFAEQRRLQFDSRVFSLAKDADYPEEDQDALRIDGRRGVAAIADGVSSSLFARLWARLLVEAAVDAAPNPDDREALAAWLAGLRAAWSRQIDVSRLAWFQKPKLREGAFSTLLCVRLAPPGDASEEGGSSWRLQGVAIGDSCLFHVREGTLLGKFPLQTSAELECDPVVLGSVDLNRDELLRFHRLDEPCQTGDLVVLCTDAIADWALRLEEADCPPVWETYWDMEEAVWREQILAMRTERSIRCDDTTLALLRIVSQAPAEIRADDAEGVTPAQCEASALCEGLPTPHVLQADASDSGGDLRSDGRRGPETCAERVSPEDDWVRKVVTFSGRATEGLTRGVARGVERLKKAGQAAQSKLKDYLDQWREDDR